MVRPYVVHVANTSLWKVLHRFEGTFKYMLYNNIYVNISKMPTINTGINKILTYVNEFGEYKHEQAPQHKVNSILIANTILSL